MGKRDRMQKWDSGLHYLETKYDLFFWCLISSYASIWLTQFFSECELSKEQTLEEWLW